MKDEFNQFKKVMEEHLSAINDNTGEIQVIFDYLQEVEKKVDRVNERIDNLQSEDALRKKTEVQPLSSSEKKIFLALYTEQEPLTFQDISEKCHLTMAKVREKVSILVDKGLPLQRQLSNSVMMFSLNPEFKELQAKENIINLSLESFM